MWGLASPRPFSPLIASELHIDVFQHRFLASANHDLMKWTLHFNRRLGGAQPGNHFVSFVRAYPRSGCLVELDLKSCGPLFSLFPLGRGELSLFPLGRGELSLFPFGALSFPFSLPPTPKSSIQL